MKIAKLNREKRENNNRFFNDLFCVIWRKKQLSYLIMSIFNHCVTIPFFFVKIPILFLFFWSPPIIVLDIQDNESGMIVKWRIIADYINSLRIVCTPRYYGL